MPRRMYIYGLTVLTLLLFAQCKKQPFPDVNDGEPVFHFKGLIDGAAVDLEAGVDSMYMFTDFVQSGAGLYAFSGNMDQLDCRGCGPQLGIGFYDTQNRPGGASVPPADVLRIGTYNFVETTVAAVSGKRLQFFLDSTYIRVPTSFYWTFTMSGYADTSTDPDPIVTFPNNGIAQVCLSVSDSFGNHTVLCNDVLIQDPPPSCNAFFGYNYLLQNTFRFFSGYGSPATSYWWDFGDSTYDTAAAPQKNYPGLYNPPFKVCLTVTEGNCIATHCMLVDNPNTAMGLANFMYAPVKDTVTQVMDRVLLTWTNPQGREYSSYRTGGQPGGSSFTVLKEEAYDPNEKGQATRYFEYEVDAWLYNVNQPSDSISISGSGTFAVSYPD